MSLSKTAIRYVTIVISLTLGTVFSILVIGRMLIATFRTKGATLKVKKRDKLPECLADPSLGEHKFIYLEVGFTAANIGGINMVDEAMICKPIGADHRLEDVKLHYVISGPEDKPLMLFVHGFPEFWFSWRHQIREFSKYYRVVAVDQRGYNESEKPEGVANYGLEKLCKDLKQLIPALGYDKCVLVGHDWGGAVVWKFAMEYPQLVDKLIAMNAPPLQYFEEFVQRSWTQFKMSWYVQFFQIPWVPEFSCRFNDFKMLESLFKDLKSGESLSDVIEAYKYCFSGRSGFNAPINYYRAGLWHPWRVESIKQTDCPTLIVWGDQDIALDKQLAHVPSKFVSNLTVNVIEGASHFVQMDKPEAVNKSMKEFLKID